jgi:RNA methyltransferase, TrmH family
MSEPSRAETALLRSLRDRRRREAREHFLAEGVRVVEELLASPLEVRFLAVAPSLEDTPRGGALLARARRAGVPLRTVSEEALGELADAESPQGVLAVARTPAAPASRLDLSDPPAVVLVLDAVQDPGNVGNLVRSAEALGARGVVALPGTADAWSPKVVRAAAGSLFRLPVVRLAAEEAVSWCRSAGLELLVAAADGQPLPAPPPARAALVVGNEGAGVSARMRAAGRAVAIPLRGRAESLNVGSAAAILLHELLRP